jgi:hypothetical protein
LTMAPIILCAPINSMLRVRFVLAYWCIGGVLSLLCYCTGGCSLCHVVTDVAPSACALF